MMRPATVVRKPSLAKDQNKTKTTSTKVTTEVTTKKSTKTLVD